MDPQIATEFYRERIDERVKALTVPKWKRICEEWAGRGYKMRNVDGILGVFENGWKGNGHGKKAVRRESDWNTPEDIERRRKAIEAEGDWADGKPVGQDWAAPPKESGP